MRLRDRSLVPAVQLALPPAEVVARFGENPGEPTPLPNFGERKMLGSELSAELRPVDLFPRFGKKPLPAPAPLPSLATAFSRRSALFGAVTVGAASAAPLAALAAPIKAASPLAAALQVEFQQLAHEEGTATERYDAAYERLEYPDAPEAVFCRPNDMATLRWHVWDVDYMTKRRWWGEDARIAHLRGEDYQHFDNEFNRRAAARRDEIVAAWDQWQIDKKAAEDDCGYTAARFEWNAASDRYEAFRLRLIHLPTTDRDVMAVKAAVVAERYADEDVSYLDRAIARHLKQQDDLEALCFSIVRDFALGAGAEAAHV